MTYKSYTKIILVLILTAIIGVSFFVVRKVQAPTGNNQTSINNNKNVQPAELNSVSEPSPVVSPAQKPKAQTVDPIDGALARITKKPFGIYISPKTSPVQPERFSGYHNAVDLETTSAQQNVDVPVVALCDGKLLSARVASGYGGVAIQSCNLDGTAVTVIYGHIRLSNIKPKVGEQLSAGDFLANLGTGFSKETDGERKHLHLGIHIGASVNIMGYVQSKSALSGWLDPAKYLN